MKTGHITVRRTYRHALTLVELLVAMTAALVLLGAVTTIFQLLGDAVTASRRLGRLDQQLDTVITKLMIDLHGVTADIDQDGLVVRSTRQDGYFEIVEGPSTDLIDYDYVTGVPFDRMATAPGPSDDSDDRIVGDWDDMLFFTTVTVTPELFHGKFGNQYDTSEVAEVAYFCRPTPGTRNPRLYTLYRRQLLVRGLTLGNPFDANGEYPVAGYPDVAVGWRAFFLDFDVSARRRNNRFVLNGMEDLEHRNYRFAHDPAINAAAFITHANPILALDGPREGEDILLTNVLAFDVRVLDPAVEIRPNAPVTLIPGDPGYAAAPISNLVGPQFVDLGYRAFVPTAAESAFSELGVPDNPLTPLSAAGPRTFDTASVHDEPPAYSAPLGGISITVRLYDASTRRVRQATLKHLFSR